MGEQIVELNIDGKTGQVEIHTEGSMVKLVKM